MGARSFEIISSLKPSALLQSCIVNWSGASCKMMNCRPTGNHAYVPTELEHVANIITHGLLVIPSIIGFQFMLQQASSRIQLITVFIYGFALISLFAVSTIFHSVFYIRKFRHLKDVLHRCDRAVIYIFIAASYTPWLMLKEMEPDRHSRHMWWLVWLFAVGGMIYQHLYHEKYKWFETLLYLLLGLLPSIAVLHMQEWSGLSELALGGGIYIAGIYFFKSDGRIPCAHAIWHLFVIVGAGLHFYAVCKYLLGKHNGIYLENHYELTIRVEDLIVCRIKNVYIFTFNFWKMGGFFGILKEDWTAQIYM